MKVLILSFEMPPYVVGGIGTVAYEEIRGFKKLGYKVTVIAPKDDRTFDLNVTYHGIGIHGNIKKMFKMLLLGIQICRKEKIDFIYSLSGTYSGMVAFILSKIFHIPYFTVAHGNEFLRFKDNKLIKKLINLIYKNSAKVFAVSEFTKSKLIEFGVNEEKISVCYNGVNLEKYHEIPENERKSFLKGLGIDKNKFVLLTLSRLDKRKNHIAVIKAIEKIKEEDPQRFDEIVYLIGGKGKEYGSLLKYIEEKKLKKKVKLLGFVNEKDINTLYNIADLFVMPNIFVKEEGNVEGFGLVFLEAGATKLASIGGKEGGSAEVIDDGINGYLVNGNDIEDLKKKILFLMENRKKLDELSQKAYKKARKYSWDNIMQNINREILKEIGKSNER